MQKKSKKTKEIVMRKVLCVFLSFTIILAGCAGRQANPVPIYLPGDESRSCTGYMSEIAQLEADMDRILPDTSKFGQNALCVAGGILLIVPFFFMDLSNADKAEWEALRKRRNRLLVYAAEAGCDFSANYRPIPSLEEMEKMKKEANKEESK
jgi:hypothetical protein